MVHLDPQNRSVRPTLPASNVGQADPIELLLSRCAARDERALQELYEIVAPQLFGILMRILRRRAAAEEALQDVMVRIWERAAQYVAYRVPRTRR